jgi:beta-phosphoglucomutase-like phosphatase (HAD superfamily)
LRGAIDGHLAHFGLADCFAAIVAAGEYPAAKPDPAPYLTGLDAISRAAGRRFDPTRTVAIEDSGNGVLSARAAGMPVLGFVARVPRERLPGCFAYVDDFRGLTHASVTALLAGR